MKVAGCEVNQESFGHGRELGQALSMRVMHLWELWVIFELKTETGGVGVKLIGTRFYYTQVPLKKKIYLLGTRVY